MVSTTYTEAYKRERVYEGGNDDDPQDPGGRTSRGIIQREYDAYRRRKGLSPQDVWKASESEIAEIYRVQYWDAVQGDELPPGIDMFVFDGAVNSGPKQSIKWLQRALDITADGVIGQVTLDALEADDDHDQIIAKMATARSAFLRALKTFPRFGRGWMSRVDNLTKASQALASGSIGPSPISVADFGGHTKARITNVATPPVSVETGAATTVATTTASGVIDQIQSVASQLSPFQDTLTVVKYIVIAIAVISAGITIYSIIRRKQINAVLE